MPTRLTDRVVKKLEVPERGNRVTYDDVVKGFGCRVTALGRRTFVLNYYVHGRERRLTIGDFPGEHSVESARAKARALRRDIRDGFDPLQKREDDRREPTVEHLWDLYEEEHLDTKAEASQREDRSQWKRFLKRPLGKLKLSQVSRADVEAIQRALRKTPARGNRVVALMSVMFNLAVRHEWMDRNPAQGIKKLKERGKNRSASVEELKRLLGVLDGLPDQGIADLFRLIIYTGSRQGEVKGAAWEEIDWERSVWTKPASRTKQARVHRIPLSAPALEVLRRRKEASNGSAFVFPSRRLSDKPVQDLKRPWKKIHELAELHPETTIHSLRHAFATVYRSVGGESRAILGALMGHSQSRTTDRYGWLFDDPLRRDAELVGEFVSSLSSEEAES